jgi:hypothetical protein
MTENKMAQVAALFGKKLDEPFQVQIEVIEKVYTYKFSKNGLLVKGHDGIGVCWTRTDAGLTLMCRGLVEIVED